MIVAIAAIGGGLMLLERLIPSLVLPKSRHWWKRVIFLNLIQLGIVLLGGITWDIWLQKRSLLTLSSNLSAPVGGLLAYVIVTFAFYWWHRWRHNINFLWTSLHQLHHSASRIETITSFFKHPLEITLNSIIIGSITYGILGLSLDAVAWLTLFTALGEYFYHMNIRTPHWVGYFFQRPEMHRIHHQRGKHYNNFSDLPIWDQLFGTYENPKDSDVLCGFTSKRENRFWDMLCFRNVSSSTPPTFSLDWLRKIAPYVLIGIGALQMLGYLTNIKAVRGMGFATVASPLPLVFSHFRGTEPFSSQFYLDIVYQDGRLHSQKINPELYSRLKGPYSRRNVYGAVMAFGPGFQSVDEKQLWTDVMSFGLCHEEGILQDFGINDPIEKAVIRVKLNSKKENNEWKKEISCSN